MTIVRNGSNMTLSNGFYHLYQKPEKTLWQGRKETTPHLYVHENIQLCDLAQALPPPNSHAFIGFACDEGVKRNQGRIGAADGPKALRAAFGALPAHTTHTLVDVGNVICRNGNLEKSQLALAHAIAAIRSSGSIPIVLGGGHEVAWGHYLGLSLAHPQEEISIVNIDAHLDMRPLLEKKFGTSGTAFLQMAEACIQKKQTFHYTCIGLQRYGNNSDLYKTAKKHHVDVVMAEDIHLKGQDAAKKVIDSILASKRRIYLTLCLDVFATPFANGVSAPQVLGLFPWHIIPLIRQLALSGQVIGFDIAELSPPLDSDGRTAKLAASLIAAFLDTQPNHF
jgi:formiminoglutamase